MLVFDKNYNLVNLAYQQLDGAYVQSGAIKAPHQLLSKQVVMNHNTTLGDNLLADPVEGSTQGFPINQDVTITSETREGEPYIHVVSNSNGTTSGVQPLRGGAIACLPGETYTFSVKGFAVSASPVVLYVGMGNTNYDFVWPGPSFASGGANEGWTTVTYTIPAGQTEMRLGVLFTSSNIGDEFYITGVSLKKSIHSIEPEYQYHLKDHLGNVRTTFTAKDETEAPTATLETATAATEQSKFLRYDNARKVQSTWFDHTNRTATGYAERLNGSANEKYGIARSISVMPGDKINAEVYAKFVDTNSSNWTAALNTLLSQIASGTASAGTVVDGAGYSSSTSSFSFAGLIDKSGAPVAGPKAYLNWLVFDKNFVLLNGGYKKMSDVAKEYGQDVAHEYLNSPDINITEPGYVYIYLSNEESSQVEVYFDDFKVTHMKSPVVQQDEYYPFGLTFNSYSRENSTPNNYLYNGKEVQDELNLEWYDYQARQYDPAIGRWMAIDPMSEVARRWSPYQYAYNNPIRFIDPDGMLVDDYYGSTDGKIFRK